jgi:hypothetical protein
LAGRKQGLTCHMHGIHALRRNTVRNMMRGDVCVWDVARKIIEPQKRAVSSRHNITDTGDIHDALIKVGHYARIQQRARIECVTAIWD